MRSEHMCYQATWRRVWHIPIYSAWNVRFPRITTSNVLF